MNKRIAAILALILPIALLAGCAQEKPAAVVRDNDIVTITLDYEKQSGFASNQFAVWIEDTDGNLIKTLFVTEFTVKTGFEKRPDALPVWVSRAMPTKQSTPDATSGATPKSGELTFVWDLNDQNGMRVADGTYQFFVEGTLRWKNHVLYSDEITLNGAATSVEASAEYIYAASDAQAALSPDSPENAMLSHVIAAYIPPKNS